MFLFYSLLVIQLLEYDAYMCNMRYKFKDSSHSKVSVNIDIYFAKHRVRLGLNPKRLIYVVT